MSRSDSEHQVISVTGSPRVAASSSPRTAWINPGWVSSAFFRPPPARRGGNAPSSPSSISATPAATMVSDTPAARATTAIPP